MKFFVCLIVLCSCALGYVYIERPDFWSAKLAEFRTPTNSISPSANASENVQANSPETNAISTVSRAVRPLTIPSTITTLSGKTYTECVLSHVAPDGISFMHSLGVAKVLFTDLDPAFATKFGYDPMAAQKYEDDQAQQAAASDAQRNAAVANVHTSTNEPTAEVAPATSSAPAERPVLSSKQREEIKAHIAALQSDISLIQRQGAVTTKPGQTLYDVGGNRGVFAEKIAVDQEQIARLQRQLQ